MQRMRKKMLLDLSQSTCLKFQIMRSEYVKVLPMSQKLSLQTEVFQVLDLHDVIERGYPQGLNYTLLQTRTQAVGGTTAE